MTPAIGVALLGAGIGLGYAAITGQSPIEEARKALTTGSADGRPTETKGFGDTVIGRAFGSIGSALGRVTDVVTGGSTSSAAGTYSAPASAGGAWPKEPASLASIGQGSHRLDPRAAAAFAAWEKGYGRKIPVTDSFRSYAQQEAAYQRDPKRFASPDGSAHVEGRAVDVNLGALGLNPGGSPSDWLKAPGYAALVNAAKAAGWCNYQIARGSTNGRTAEPWHFSFGVCK